MSLRTRPPRATLFCLFIALAGKSASRRGRKASTSVWLASLRSSGARLFAPEGSDLLHLSLLRRSRLIQNWGPGGSSRPTVPHSLCQDRPCRAGGIRPEIFRPRGSSWARLSLPSSIRIWRAHAPTWETGQHIYANRSGPCARQFGMRWGTLRKNAVLKGRKRS
ncbi:unnamed protein product [Protopolystoma xenopodis]|uniref:Secreted protein n=1 Tax=Protopolystoma xenopodis TaxID=117903 RepID=A0A448WTD8_9PLAT|nr:unnamed protein product [Protopolystoma xenopodis]